MVEGAICAAIAIVFNLLFAYVPFMGIILNLCDGALWLR